MAKMVHVATSQCTLRSRFGVDAQGQAATAGLIVVAFTCHVALGLVNFLGSGKLVAAEALAAVFGTGETEALGVAVGNAFGVGDGAVTNVGELDAGEHTVFGFFVRETSVVAESADCGYGGGTGGCWTVMGDGCPGDFGLGDVGGD